MILVVSHHHTPYFRHKLCNKFLGFSGNVKASSHVPSIVASPHPFSLPQHLNSFLLYLIQCYQSRDYRVIWYLLGTTAIFIAITVIKLIMTTCLFLNNIQYWLGMTHYDSYRWWIGFIATTWVAHHMTGSHTSAKTWSSWTVWHKRRIIWFPLFIWII